MLYAHKFRGKITKKFSHMQAHAQKTLFFLNFEHEIAVIHHILVKNRINFHFSPSFLVHTTV